MTIATSTHFTQYCFTIFPRKIILGKFFRGKIVKALALNLTTWHLITINNDRLSSQTWVKSLLYPPLVNPIPPSEAMRPLLGASVVVLAR